MLHQSEAYYEHCNAADLDPARSTDDRLRCWSAWVEHYHQGMPPERVSHARRRLVALESGITIAPLPDVTPSYTSTFMALEAAPPSASTSPESTADASVATTAERTPPATTDANETRTDTPPSDGRPSDAGSTAVPTAERTSPSSHPARDPSDVPPRPRPLAPRASSPTHPCTPVCQPRWDACVDRASTRGLDGLEACRIEHRVCMNGCM